MNPHAGLARPPFFDFSSRAKFVVRGKDRIRFLNGQVTNDVRKADAHQTVEACVLSAKGKVDAHLFISAPDDLFFLDAEPELRELLPARLDCYLIADEVEIEDVTDAYGLFHVVGEAGDLPNEWRQARAVRFLQGGCDIWVKISEAANARDFLSARFAPADEIRAETLRIECGLPRWGKELTSEIIPIEANLEARAVDYAKGCYIGQEVISRIKMSGQTNKKLCGLKSRDGGQLPPGTRLFAVGSERRDVGWITSETFSEKLGRRIALGFVKRGYNAPGTELSASISDSSLEVRAEVSALPWIDA